MPLWQRIAVVGWTALISGYLLYITAWGMKLDVDAMLNRKEVVYAQVSAVCGGVLVACLGFLLLCFVSALWTDLGKGKK